MSKVFLVLLASLFMFDPCRSEIRDITEPDVIRNIYLRVEKSLWDNIMSNPSKSRTDRLKSIFMDHNSFVNTYLKNYLDIDDLKMLIQLNGWHNLQSEIINVHQMFMLFQQHINREAKYVDKGEFNEEVSVDLTDHILDDSQWPLREAIENLHKVIVQENLYANQLSVLAETSCTLQRSCQQMLYQLYNAITIVELEAYIMMQASFMLRNVYKRGNFTTNSKQLRSNFEQKIVDSLQETQEIFDRSERSIWRCDPKAHKEDETFIQITRLLQGHIENEIDLNRDRSCTDSCENFQFVESIFGCSQKSICNQQPKCQGKILNCFTVEDGMWICPGNKTGLRRYEYITYDYGRILGQPKYCTPGNRVAKSWLYNIVFLCNHCFCICDEQGKKSDRYFSLRPVVSDVKSNMVVTGFRFVKEQRIVHLQVQESQLIKFGKVDASTSKWVPTRSFTILDKGIKDGIDYHTLAYDRREVDLDDLVAPNGHVVTGLKFRRLGNHLNLEMRVSEINFSTGTVDPDKSFWLSNDNTENSSGGHKRNEIRLRWPHVPTESKQPSVPLSNSNTFIKFTHSDIGKDAAQTTVPFLDSQAVMSNPVMPLQGVGLFYKGRQGFGGFIAPRIETLDFSSYIKANLFNFKRPQ